MKYYDDEHLKGVDVTPDVVGHMFHQALSTQGTGDDPSAPLKAFLFLNAASIIDFLKGLNEERRALPDGAGGMMVDYRTGEITSTFKPCTVQKRYATPWVVVDD